MIYSIVFERLNIEVQQAVCIAEVRINLLLQAFKALVKDSLYVYIFKIIFPLKC